MEHKAACRWERTTSAECEYRDTHHYCPHPEHACDCNRAGSTKPDADAFLAAVLLVRLAGTADYARAALEEALIAKQNGRR